MYNSHAKKERSLVLSLNFVVVRFASLIIGVFLVVTFLLSSREQDNSETVVRQKHGYGFMLVMEMMLNESRSCHVLC